ncbi:hypothetical protein RN607_06115 [Demequina capsici]|uniref:Uncharacterized protein n=1 Tax=Demequina capsici TaxID=3075620 RepID=A0AA96F9G1_9MICO|nr:MULTISPECIES: hypothetical protein [unclassified Demequina]WNM25684.1 hypothetical protein RN606_05910 [Demequina sp. OYTSA14]WNM28579.1 hypothetical protein RN607_06115 [Demequina sp. PMTSA13]
MLIDCDTCEMRGRACGDCVVSFLTIPVRPGAAPAPIASVEAPVTSEPVHMDADQLKAVANLAAGGLVAPLRLVERRRAG